MGIFDWEEILDNAWQEALDNELIKEGELNDYKNL